MLKHKLIFCNGSFKTFIIKNIRLQIYFPQFRIFTTDFSVQLDTRFRILLNEFAFGIAFSCLGFGFGIDTERKCANQVNKG